MKPTPEQIAETKAALLKHEREAWAKHTSTHQCWAVIAYRWGWLNAHHYVVRCTTDRQAAIDAAEAEAERRGGKYGCTVYDAAGKANYHAHSSYGETAAAMNWRIDMFERFGQEIVRQLETGKALDVFEITTRYREAKDQQEAIELAFAQNVRNLPRDE